MIKTQHCTRAGAQVLSLSPTSPGVPPLRGDKSVHAIPTRILRLPIPQIAAHCREVLLCTESELNFCECGVCRQIWNVTAPDDHHRQQGGLLQKQQCRLNVPTTYDVVTIIESGFLAHCFDDLQHAEALPAPEVVRFEPRRRRAIVKRG